jgi:hypothetical protein
MGKTITVRVSGKLYARIKAAGCGEGMTPEEILRYEIAKYAGMQEYPEEPEYPEYPKEPDDPDGCGPPSPRTGRRGRAPPQCKRRRNAYSIIDTESEGTGLIKKKIRIEAGGGLYGKFKAVCRKRGVNMKYAAYGLLERHARLFEEMQEEPDDPEIHNRLTDMFFGVSDKEAARRMKPGAGRAHLTVIRPEESAPQGKEKPGRRRR